MKLWIGEWEDVTHIVPDDKDAHIEPGEGYLLVAVDDTVAQQLLDAWDRVAAAKKVVMEAAGYDETHRRLVAVCSDWVGLRTVINGSVFFDECHQCGWPADQHPDERRLLS